MVFISQRFLLEYARDKTPMVQDSKDRWLELKVLISLLLAFLVTISLISTLDLFDLNSQGFLQRLTPDASFVSKGELSLPNKPSSISFFAKLLPPGPRPECLWL